MWADSSPPAGSRRARDQHADMAASLVASAARRDGNDALMPQPLPAAAGRISLDAAGRKIGAN
jgi:hypothetical protein